MTIEQVVRWLETIHMMLDNQAGKEACEAAVASLAELQKYQEIGDFDEVKNAKKYMDLARRHGTIGAVIDACVEYEKIGTPEEIKDVMRMISEASDDDGINIGVIEERIELGKYREIGTIEECREAVEKQTPKAPAYEGDGYDEKGNIVYDTWICPSCGEKYEVDYDDYDHCPKCGQAILNESSLT